jgi:hypothetical protein
MRIMVDGYRRLYPSYGPLLVGSMCKAPGDQAISRGFFHRVARLGFTRDNPSP